jgi:hypothetical protein
MTNKNKPTAVVVETVTIGQFFGTGALLRSARTGRVMARTSQVRPYGYTAAAAHDAEELAADRGFRIVDEDS